MGCIGRNTTIHYSVGVEGQLFQTKIRGKDLTEIEYYSITTQYILQ